MDILIPIPISYCMQDVVSIFSPFCCGPSAVISSPSSTSPITSLRINNVSLVHTKILTFSVGDFFSFGESNGETKGVWGRLRTPRKILWLKMLNYFEFP